MNVSRILPIAAILGFVICTAGCQNRAETPIAANAAAPAKPGPEESFQLIVETFRRGVEDVPIGFVQRGADGHSMMTGKIEVDHRLIEPEKESEPYKAIITVGSQSHYSIQRSTETESEDVEKTADQRNNLLANDEQDGLEIFDRDLISTSGSPSKRRSAAPAQSSETTVARKADRQERNYELIYENGKWKLITKLDPETEQSIQNAFRRALDTQI